MPKVGNTQIAGGSGAAEDFFAITPNDSTDLAQPVRGIYVAGAGTVTVKNAAGVNVLFTGVPAGSVLPVTTSRVMATGTAATGLVGLV